MNKNQRQQHHIRKRLSYTPIMLTSKSMRPVNRQQRTHYRNISSVHKQNSYDQSLDLYFAVSMLKNHQCIDKEQPLKNELQHFQITQEQQQIVNSDLSQTIERTHQAINQRYQNLQNHIKTSHKKRRQKQKNQSNQISIIDQNPNYLNPKKKNIQLQNIGIHLPYEEYKNRKNYEKGNQRQSNSNRPQIQIKKYIYFTNNRQPNKFNDTTKNKQATTNTNIPFIKNQQIKNMCKLKNKKHSEQWGKYLFKHYLNIKKVNPITKNDRLTELQQLSSQFAEEINNKVQNILEKQQMIARKSTPIMRSLNKRFKQKTKISSHLDHQTQTYAQIQQNITMKKIQQDITSMTKRLQINKKQYFVFGLNDNTRQIQNSENILKSKIEIYRDFLFKINFTNGIYVKNRQDVDKLFKFYVGKGNNSMLIRGILRRRYWWNSVEKQEDANFVWTQLKVTNFLHLLKNFCKNKSYKNLPKNRKNSKAITKQKEIYDSIISCSYKNLVEYPQIKQLHGQKSQTHRITKKKMKFENQKAAIQFIQMQDQVSDPNSKIMMGSDYKIWKNHYRKFKKYQDKFQQNIYLKRFNSMLTKKQINIIQQPFNTKIHNHLECNYYLGNKKALFYYMRRYYNALSIDPFTKIPLTFHISKGLEDPQYHKFIQKYEQFIDKKKDNPELKNIWIVKPGQYSNRGKGITVCSYLDQIKIRLKGKQKNLTLNQPRTFIVQKYIEKPLLYNKRKFDIRHYMLLTCFNGIYKGYWYSQGYLRTTSYEYNIKNTKDIFTHLTNDAVQQNCNDYGKFQRGNKLSYQDFQKYLDNQKSKKNNSCNGNIKDGYNFFTDTIPKMKQLAIDSMKATYHSLSPHRKMQSFQLFGLDFMLDEDFNVYLIEVNTNPCLQTSCPLLSKLISGLIQNVFKICIDPFFPPPLQWSCSKKFQMGQNALQENKFELVFDEKVHGQSIQKILHGQQIGNIGDIVQDDDTYQDEGNQWNQDA